MLCYQSFLIDNCTNIKNMLFSRNDVKKLVINQQLRDVFFQLERGNITVFESDKKYSIKTITWIIFEKSTNICILCTIGLCFLCHFVNHY